MTNIYSYSAALAFSIALTACGGGSSEKSAAPITPTQPTNTAPTVTVANIIADENTPITITAIASDDDGDTLNYSWEQTSGEAITFTNGSSFISFDAPEVANDSEYTFKVSVSDGILTTRANSIITVKNNNRIPTISVENITVEENTPVTLAAITNDADGDTLTYTWLQLSGNAIDFTSNGASISFEAPEVEVDSEFSLEVSVSDGIDSANSSAIVTVLNVPKIQTREEMLVQLLSEVRTTYYDIMNDIQVEYGDMAKGWMKFTSIDIGSDGIDDILWTFASHEDDEHHIQGKWYAYTIVVNAENNYEIKKLNIKADGRDIIVNDFDNNGEDDVYLAAHGYDKSPHPGDQDQLLMQFNGQLVDMTDTNVPTVNDFSHAACSGDLTGNNYADVIVSQGNYTLFKYNNGDAEFTEQSAERLPLNAISFGYLLETDTIPEEFWGNDMPLRETRYWWCEVADWNGDGNNDIILGGNGSAEHDLVNIHGDNTNYKHLILINDGTGKFSYDDSELLSYGSMDTSSIMGTNEVMPMIFDGDECADVYTESHSSAVQSFNFYVNSCGAETTTYTWEFNGITDFFKLSDTSIGLPFIDKKLEYINGVFVESGFTDQDAFLLSNADYVALNAFE